MLRESVPWKFFQATCSYFRGAVDGKGYSKDGQCLNQSDWVSVDIKEYSMEELLKFLWNYTRWLGQIFPQPESGSRLNFPTWHLGKHLQTLVPGGPVCLQGQDRTQALDDQAAVSLCPEDHISLLRADVSLCWVSWQVYIPPSLKIWAPKWISTQMSARHKIGLYTWNKHTDFKGTLYTRFRAGVGGGFMDCYRHCPVSFLSLHCTQSIWM